MQENNAEHVSGDFVTNFSLFLSFMLKKWWLLLLFITVGIGTGLVYYDKQKSKYEAACTFILEEKSGGSGGGLASLATQFGLNVGGLGSGGSIFAGDNILDILKSKKVVRKVLLTPLKISDPKSQTLVDYYIDVIDVRQKWKQNPQLASIQFNRSEEKMNPIQDSILNDIYDKLITENIFTDRLSRQSTIIKLQVIAEDPVFARIMTERLVEEASKLYLDVRVGSAQENISNMQRRSDSLLYLLNNKSYRAAASQPLDLNPGIRTAIVPTEIANRDKAVLATLYAEVTKNLEASKLLLSQQTPIIQLLDRPGYLLHDNKKGLGFILGVSVVIAGAVFLVGAYIIFLIKQAMRKQLLPQ